MVNQLFLWPFSITICSITRGFAMENGDWSCSVLALDFLGDFTIKNRDEPWKPRQIRSNPSSFWRSNPSSGDFSPSKKRISPAKCGLRHQHNLGISVKDVKVCVAITNGLNWTHSARLLVATLAVGQLGTTYQLQPTCLANGHMHGLNLDPCDKKPRNMTLDRKSVV